MPQPLKPAALKELNGSAKHNPDRVNHDAPVPTGGIGPPPKHLLKAEREVWDELVGSIYAGVLGEGDKQSFEMMVKLFYRFRWAGRRKEVLYLSNGELSSLIKLFSLFGMTPSDRQRIKVTKKGEKKSNPFAKK